MGPEEEAEINDDPEANGSVDSEDEDKRGSDEDTGEFDGVVATCGARKRKG